MHGEYGGWKMGAGVGREGDKSLGVGGGEEMKASCLTGDSKAQGQHTQWKKGSVGVKAGQC